MENLRSIIATKDRIELCGTVRVDPDLKAAAEELIRDIPQTAIEFLHSQKDAETDGDDDDDDDDDDEPDQSENEDAIADIFCDFSDEANTKQGEQHEEEQRSGEPKDRDIREFGETSGRRTHGGVRPEDVVPVPKRLDGGIRQYRRRLRRPMQPEAPAAPTVSRLDPGNHSVYEWHHHGEI